MRKGAELNSIYQSERQKSISPLDNPHKGLKGEDKKGKEFPGINTKYYQGITERILSKYYPKYCPKCSIELTKTIPTRDYAIRCKKCHYQTSRLSYTPLHHLKLPLWMFGYILHESTIQHPKVITSTEITKRLKISYKSALLLKRRIQLFATYQLEGIKKLIYNELEYNFKDFNLPRDKKADLTEIVKDKNIPQSDTLALFSCSQRANKGRKRYKKTGQTSSIYMSESLGGHQVGTLVNTFGWKGGPVLYDSIPNLQMETVSPILNKYLPKDTPLFTDMGYTWFTSKNHRMVNHSARSKDKRYKWGKNRWSDKGVHNQVAEGNNGLLKRAFANYGWFKPEYSQLYLNEFSYFKSAKYYGLGIGGESKAESGPGGIFEWSVDSPFVPSRESTLYHTCVDCKEIISTENQWLTRQILFKKYIAKSLIEFQVDKVRNTKASFENLLKSFEHNKKLQKAIIAYKYFNGKPQKKYKRRKEKLYREYANTLWKLLPTDGWVELNVMSEIYGLPINYLRRIVRVWASLKIVKVVDRTFRDGIHNQIVYDVYKNIDSQLPSILYMQNRCEFERNEIYWEKFIKKEYPKKRSKRKYD